MSFTLPPGCLTGAPAGALARLPALFALHRKRIFLRHRAAYLLVLTAPIAIDYCCAIGIEGSCDPVVRRRWLAAGVGSNILLLAYFKYANFFLGSVAAIAGFAPRLVAIVLPFGISFFTFKAIGYLVEVYRGELSVPR